VSIVTGAGKAEASTQVEAWGAPDGSTVWAP
jgi:hypothetical protein